MDVLKLFSPFLFFHFEEELEPAFSFCEEQPVVVVVVVLEVKGLEDSEKYLRSISFSSSSSSPFFP